MMATQNCSDIRTEVDLKRPIHCLGMALSVHHLPGVTCHHHRDCQESWGVLGPGWCDAPVQSNVTVSRRTPRWLRAPRVTGDQAQDQRDRESAPCARRSPTTVVELGEHSLSHQVGEHSHSQGEQVALTGILPAGSQA